MYMSDLHNIKFALTATPNSDDEIKSVHGRLASLERMLETFMSNQSSNNSSSSPASTSTGPTLSAPRDNQLLSSDPDFEGDSSFSAHSRDITQVIERGLRSSAGSESDGDVEAAVATLRNFLNEKSPQSDIPTPPQTTLRNVVDYPELSNLTLPSMPAVLNMLRYIKSMQNPLPTSTPLTVEHSTPLEISGGRSELERGPSYLHMSKGLFPY